MLTKNEIKHIRQLQDKKHRDETGLFTAEGTKWVKELATWQPSWIKKIYALPAWIDAEGAGMPAHLLEETDLATLERISALTTPAGVLALVKKPQLAPLTFLPGKWNLVLDGVQDPGNLGSIIRIADWFGLDRIWCSDDCADAFNPKVVQATMGSLCRVQVWHGDIAGLLSTATLPVFAATTTGRDVFGIHTHEGILIIGSEGKGIRPEIMALAAHSMTIPRIGHAESLNAAVAAGIMVARLTAAAGKSKGH